MAYLSKQMTNGGFMIPMWLYNETLIVRRFRGIITSEHSVQAVRLNA